MKRETLKCTYCDEKKHNPKFNDIIVLFESKDETLKMTPYEALKSKKELKVTK